MELHKAIKEIVASKGAEMIGNIQIINYLLDYQAFKEKPATKLILRAIIDSGYAENILALVNTTGWETKFKQYQHEFIDSCGYKEELAAYVFESIAYGLGLNAGNEEPEIKPAFNVDSFFDIPEVEQKQQPSPQPQQKQNADPSDLYTIALSFFNEGKYNQAKTFIEKSISLYPISDIPSVQLKLKGDINLKLVCYAEAINDYNNSLDAKAKEVNCTKDKLRESLQQHNIKEFENILFCYYFCLYSIGKISKGQWLKLVKDEAIYGLNDAIMYCVNNGINPIDEHFDIFFIDYSELHYGDYLYSDGTFSHELSSSKKVVARVIKIETTKYEQSKGWNHGYLVPIKEDGREKCSQAVWSTENVDLPFPHSHYTADDINHWNEIKTIESEQYIIITDYNKYPAFKAINDFSLKIPISNTSGWFLPSIHWFKRCRPTSIISVGDFWTSSQADISKALFVGYHLSSYKHSYFTIDSFEFADKNQIKKILPVAAF